MMEKYIQEVLREQESLELEDEYICSECGNIVKLIIDGKCINCSNQNKQKNCS